MSKIERYQGDVKAFASNALGLERTVFGGTTQANDLTSQVTAAFLRGWGIVGPSEHPSLEDFNAAMYAMSQFIAYQHQVGIPEWHAAQEYHAGSVCTHGGVSYQSLDDENIGNEPPSVEWTPVLTGKSGSEVFQPKNGNLTALSSLAGAAGRIPYFTSPGVMSLLAGFGANATTTTVTSPGGGFAFGVRTDGAWSVVDNATGNRIPLSLGAGGTGATTPSEARIKLELGTAATANIGSSTGQIPDMSFFTNLLNPEIGWAKFPGGIILQCVHVSGETGNVATAKPFPTPFPTAAIGVFVCCKNTSNAVMSQATIVDRSTFRITFRSYSSASTTSNDSGYLFAMGY